jgi:hypothetical protein
MSHMGQNAKYSHGVNDFWIAPNNGHRQSSRTPAPQYERHAVLPRLIVWRTSKPSNCGWSRCSGLLSPARLCAARNASDLVHASNTARFSQIMCEA